MSGWNKSVQSPRAWALQNNPILAVALASVIDATKGAGYVGYDDSLAYAANSAGWALRSEGGAVSILRYIPVSKWAGIAAGSNTDDLTAYYATALANAKSLYFPPGTYYGTFDLSGLRGRTICGAGRDVTTLKNYGATTPVFKLDNTASDCKMNNIAALRIANRDSATYTTVDGIAIDGTDTNENDFHTFTQLEITGVRHGIRFGNRSVWNTFRDVHVYSCINDGLHVDTSQNISEQKFVQCRFGQNGSYGAQITKSAGDLFSGWSFDTCTFEKNRLCGMRFSGASGIEGLSLHTCYFEENTIATSAGSVTPRKANIWVDAAYFIADLRGGTFFGTPQATALDYSLYVEDACTNCYVEFGANRYGTFTVAGTRLPGTAAYFRGAELNSSFVGSTSSGGRSLSDISLRVTDTYTGTLTGCTTSPTATLRVELNGGTVACYVPALNGTASGAGGTCTITGMPAAYRPARLHESIGLVTNGGTNGFGRVQIDTDGTLKLYPDAVGSTFGVGTKGSGGMTLTWILT